MSKQNSLTVTFRFTDDEIFNVLGPDYAQRDPLHMAVLKNQFFGQDFACDFSRLPADQRRVSMQYFVATIINMKSLALAELPEPRPAPVFRIAAAPGTEAALERLAAYAPEPPQIFFIEEPNPKENADQ